MWTHQRAAEQVSVCLLCFPGNNCRSCVWSRSRRRGTRGGGGGGTCRGRRRGREPNHHHHHLHCIHHHNCPGYQQHSPPPPPHSVAVAQRWWVERAVPTGGQQGESKPPPSSDGCFISCLTPHSHTKRIFTQFRLEQNNIPADNFYWTSLISNSNMFYCGDGKSDQCYQGYPLTVMANIL